jgi:hypothetical protein
MGVTGEPNDGEIRLSLLRQLERWFAETAPEKIGLLAAIRELISEAEAEAAPSRDNEGSDTLTRRELP